MKKKSNRGRPPLQPRTIGVDAAILGDQDKRVQVGVYRIAVNLLRFLARSDKKNHYILYSFSPIDQMLMQDFGENMKNMVLPKIGWFTWWLPLALRFQKPDVFLALSQAVPNTTIPSIGFIYDVAFEHDANAYGKSAKKLHTNSYRLSQAAQHIITISKASKQDIVDVYSVPDRKITVAYPGVSMQFSSSGPRYIDTRPYFLYVGAFKKTKNIPFLINAFAQFQKVAPEEYRLLLVGSDFWLDDGIKQAIEHNNLSEYVVIKGYVSDDDLAKYYRGACGFVSLSQQEGFNLPILEAMNCGAPIIASHIPVHSEIVADAGILVDINDMQSVVDAFVLVSQDESTKNAFQRKSLKRAQKFSWKEFTQPILKEIKNE